MTAPLQCPAAQRHQTRLDPQISGPGAAPAGPGPDYTLASAAATSLASSAAAPVSAAAANGSATLLTSAPSAAAANGGQQTHLGTQASVRFCEAPWQGSSAEAIFPDTKINHANITRLCPG